MTEQIQQRTPEWYAARKGRITGSSVGAILGLSPFDKPKDVMRRMVREFHGAESEFEGNSATQYGTFHESIAISYYELETRNKVTETGFWTNGDWLGASPDGIVNNIGLIEIKCPYGKKDKVIPDFKSIKDQPHYFAQIQIQLYVTGKKWCDFYQWSAHGSMLEEVEIDTYWIGKNIHKLATFYDEYCIERQEPNCNKHLEPLHQTLDCDVILDCYLSVKKQIEALKIQKEELLDELVTYAQHKDSEINGHKLTKVTREGSISYAKAIKDLMPDADLSAYKGKPTSYWRLS